MAGCCCSCFSRRSVSPAPMPKYQDSGTSNLTHLSHLTIQPPTSRAQPSTARTISPTAQTVLAQAEDPGIQSPTYGVRRLEQREDVAVDIFRKSESRSAAPPSPFVQPVKPLIVHVTEKPSPHSVTKRRTPTSIVSAISLPFSIKVHSPEGVATASASKPPLPKIPDPAIPPQASSLLNNPNYHYV